MKGLLYKEWATLTSSYKQSLFFFAFLYGGISILTGQTGMAYGLLVIFSILIEENVTALQSSFRKVIHQLFLLERQVLETGNPVT